MSHILAVCLLKMQHSNVSSIVIRSIYLHSFSLSHSVSSSLFFFSVLAVLLLENAALERSFVQAITLSKQLAFEKVYEGYTPHCNSSKFATVSFIVVCVLYVHSKWRGCFKMSTWRSQFSASIDTMLTAGYIQNIRKMELVLCMVAYAFVCACVRVCVRACACVCVRVCMCMCARACEFGICASGFWERECTCGS